MNAAEYQREWTYILNERRGMIAGAAELTPDEEALAQQEAREHMDRLEKFPLDITAG